MAGPGSTISPLEFTFKRELTGKQNTTKHIIQIR